MNNKNLQNNDEFSLFEILSFFVPRWWIFVITITLGFIVAVINYSKSPALYQVSLLVKPTEIDTQISMPNTSNLLGAMFGGITPQNNNILKYENTLRSIKLAKSLKNNEIFTKLFFEEKQISKIKSKISLIDRVLGFSEPPEKSVEDDVLMIHRFLNKSFETETTRGSDITKISLNHTNPLSAEKIILLVHNEINQINRENDIKSFDMFIENLEQKIEKTANITQKNILIQLLLKYHNNKMMAEVGEDYFASVFDIIPYTGKRVSPVFRNFMMFGFIGGVVFGFMIIVLLFFVNEYQKNKMEK